MMNMNVGNLVVALFQKRRGQGGKYEEVLGGDCVRVDKNKGKILKALVFSPEVDLSTVDLDVQIALSTDSNTVFTNEGVTVETMKFGDKKPCLQVEMMLKLLRNAKSLQLYVTASHCGVCVACGSTVWFQSHNNGKQKSNTRTKDVEVPLTQMVPSTPESAALSVSPVSSPLPSPLPSPFVESLDFPETMFCPCEDTLFESMLLDDALNRKRSLDDMNFPFVPQQAQNETFFDWDFSNAYDDERPLKKPKPFYLSPTPFSFDPLLVPVM